MRRLPAILARGRGTLGVALIGAALMSLAGASSACAASPRWALAAVAVPRSFAPDDSSGDDQFVVEAVNVGNASAEGAVTITDKLPAGLAAVSIEGEGAGHSCTLVSLTCVFSDGPRPTGRLVVVIHVDVRPGAPASLVDEASVSGGGAGEVSASEPVQISAMPVGFGIERFSMVGANEDGSVDSQAGSHPYELTAEVGLNQTLDSETKITSVGSIKDLRFELPPGLTLNP